MNDNICKHIIWVGGLLCVTPPVVRGYMWGKGTDAVSQGSLARVTLPGYQSLDHHIVLLGAMIIAIGIIAAFIAASKRNRSPDSFLQPNEPAREINHGEGQ